MTLCPCHSQQPYSDCCEPFVTNAKLPELPAQLMRSRYTAFTQSNTDYIGATQAKSAAKLYDPDETSRWCADLEWQDLTIVEQSPCDDSATTGTVEFIAKFIENGIPKNMHEVSQFEKIEGKWYYTQGRHSQTHESTPGRNDPCSCGSGKKYKKCCGF